MRNKLLRTSTIFVLLSLLLNSNVSLSKTLVFTQNKMGETFRCAHNNLKKGYKLLGYDVSFLTLPNKRSLQKSDSGQADGEMLRVENVDLIYPNLMPVPVPICIVDLVMLGHKKVQLSQIEDIRDYHLGITMGYIHQEQFVQKYSLLATRVIRNEILLELLSLNRVDIIFLTRHEAENFIAKNDNYKILDVYSNVQNLYHYLHRKNEHLLPQITQVLQQLTDKNQLDLYTIDVEPPAKITD